MCINIDSASNKAEYAISLIIYDCNGFVMRKLMFFISCLFLATHIAACGVKPSDVKAPKDSPYQRLRTYPNPERVDY